MDLAGLRKSNIHLKILRFFHENQASIDTPRGVATWIGEDRLKVKRALEDLVKLQILIAHRTTSTTGYSYTRDAKLISKIAKILEQSKPS
ncbi:MAG: hypothetical protein NC938_01125 [Candidatus Omnitrophica bacterium]|nr:hypothetical protein [Candidatus Omnitrophota bacterium]MCM8790291.1 hypothetical protein [Candidatus Omnitrophota bacterium]